METQDRNSYDPTNLQAAAQLFCNELNKAIKSGSFSQPDKLHLQRLKGNVNKLIKEI